METSQARSLNTELNDRTLWYDGDSTVPGEKVEQSLAAGLPVEGLFVDELTKDIIRYNRFVPRGQRITVKKGIRPLKFDWNIPPKFKSMDIERHVLRHCLLQEVRCNRFTDEQFSARLKRTERELDLYKSLGLYDVLRVLVYVINTLREREVVWGVGRGSSVSSYVLYLIGAHDVDSVEFELDINDFLRAEDA